MSYVGAIGAAANATTFSDTIPAGVQANDVLFLFVAHTNTVSESSFSHAMDNSNTPRLTVTSSALVVDVYTRAMTSGDAGQTFTLTMSGTSKTAMCGVILRGVDTTNPIPSGNEADTHDTTSSRSTPALILGATDDVISYVAERLSSGNTTSWTAPSGIVMDKGLVNTGSAPNDAAVGHAVAQPAGQVGPYSWTANGTGVTAQRIGITIAPGVTGGGGGGGTKTVKYVNPSGSTVAVTSIQFLDSTGTLRTISSWSNS